MSTRETEGKCSKLNKESDEKKKRISIRRAHICGHPTYDSIVLVVDEASVCRRSGLFPYRLSLLATVDRRSSMFSTVVAFRQPPVEGLSLSVRRMTSRGARGLEEVSYFRGHVRFGHVVAWMPLKCSNHGPIEPFRYFTVRSIDRTSIASLCIHC